MAVVYSKVLLFDPPLIYTAPDICVFGAVCDERLVYINIDISGTRQHTASMTTLQSNDHDTSTIRC